jgi:hypothetical protein
MNPILTIQRDMLCGDKCRAAFVDCGDTCVLFCAIVITLRYAERQHRLRVAAAIPLRVFEIRTRFWRSLH